MNKQSVGTRGVEWHGDGRLWSRCSSILGSHVEIRDASSKPQAAEFRCIRQHLLPSKDCSRLLLTPFRSVAFSRLPFQLQQISICFHLCKVLTWRLGLSKLPFFTWVASRSIGMACKCSSRAADFFCWHISVGSESSLSEYHMVVGTTGRVLWWCPAMLKSRNQIPFLQWSSYTPAYGVMNQNNVTKMEERNTSGFSRL